MLHKKAPFFIKRDLLPHRCHFLPFIGPSLVPFSTKKDLCPTLNQTSPAQGTLLCSHDLPSFYPIMWKRNTDSCKSSSFLRVIFFSLTLFFIYKGLLPYKSHFLPLIPLALGSFFIKKACISLRNHFCSSLLSLYSLSNEALFSPILPFLIGPILF